MPQWKNTADSANSVNWAGRQFRLGSGPTNIASNNSAMVANTTNDALQAGRTLGQFPVTAAGKANTSGESSKVRGKGWAVRTVGEGQVISATASAGSGFANGETFTFANGNGANVGGVITSNATGNLASVTISGSPTYANTSYIKVNFTRELHVANLNFSNSTALTNVGNANTINVSIGNTNITYGVNAIGSFTSNSTGGITNSITQAIVWSGANVGLFSNAQTNTAVVVTFTNANGAVVGGTFTATANLVTSTGGTITPTLGGRAGRVNYELLVYVDAMANGALANATNGGLGPLPQ